MLRKKNCQTRPKNASVATDENDDGTTPDRPSSVVDDSRKRRKGERKFTIYN